MPWALAARPRKMLPPPMTTAVWTPSDWMSAMSFGDSRRHGGIDAVGLIAHQRFTRELQQDACVVPLSPRNHEDRLYPLISGLFGGLTKFEPDKARDRDVLAGLGGRGRDHLLDGDVGIADRRLIEQAHLRVVALELALDDLVDHVGGLARTGELGAIDLALLLEHLGGNVLALDVDRARGRDVHGDFLRQRLEVRRPRDEVGFAVHFDQHRDLAAKVHVVPDDPVLGDAAGALGGLRQAFLSQDSMALSTSPPDSSRAALQSIMPAPVLSRSCFTAAADAAIHESPYKETGFPFGQLARKETRFV